MADNRPVGAAGFEWLQRNSAPIDAAIAAALPSLDVRAARARQISQGTNLAQYQPTYAGGPTGLPIQFPANPNAGVPALIRRASEVPNEPWLMAYPNEVSMPAPARPAGEAPPVRFRAPTEGDTPARTAPTQASRRGAGAMPTVSYGGIPAGGLTIDQALKFLTVTKPMSPGEQAQTALLGRAAQQRGQIEQYLGTLKPTAPNYQQEVQAADQKMRNNLLDVLGGNLFQNYLAGRTVGQ